WTLTATSIDAPKAVELWHSLINTVMTYNPRKGVVPYAGVFGGEGKREAGSAPGFNIFRTLCRNTSGAYALNFLFQGFSNILNSVHEAANTYLPGSMRGAGCNQEVLVLLWKFLEENEEFERWIIEKEDINELVVPICYLMYSSRTDSTSVGLIHMCAFILLKLSGSSLSPLYGCMITTICNVSPYWRGLSLTASLKIVNLLEIFTSNKRLYGDRASSEENVGFAALILEIFNNVVQYHLHSRLPLDTVTRLLQSVLPLIDAMVSARDGVVDEEDILDLLRNTTLVGLLPVPHPIVIRQYRQNDWTGTWLTAYLWGVIFLRNQKLPIFDGDSIKLFQVTTKEGS
ncbi:hypothetical protein TrRE_jg8536, partial [Triparma retinervis]